MSRQFTVEEVVEILNLKEHAGEDFQKVLLKDLGESNAFEHDKEDAFEASGLSSRTEVPTIDEIGVNAVLDLLRNQKSISKVVEFLEEVFKSNLVLKRLILITIVAMSLSACKRITREE